MIGGIFTSFLLELLVFEDLLGHEGEFRFGCPMDEEFFREAGVSKSEFKDFVATGASDEEVEEWLKGRVAAGRV